MKFEDILTIHGKKNKYAVRTRLIKLGNELYDKDNAYSKRRIISIYNIAGLIVNFFHIIPPYL